MIDAGLKRLAALQHADGGFGWWEGDATDVAMTALQAVLTHQGEVLNGYPYVLARAHEEALVTTQDRATLEQAIQRELFSVGILAQPSNKARQKLLLGGK